MPGVGAPKVGTVPGLGTGLIEMPWGAPLYGLIVITG